MTFAMSSERYYVIVPLRERKTNLPDTPVVLAPAVVGDERFFVIFAREPGLLQYIDSRNTERESRDFVYQLTEGRERGMLVQGADAFEMMEQVEQEKSFLSRRLGEENLREGAEHGRYKNENKVRSDGHQLDDRQKQLGHPMTPGEIVDSDEVNLTPRGPKKGRGR
jgi:hypothetical protein